MRVLRIAFLSSASLEFFASVAVAIVATYVGFGLIGRIGWGTAPELTLFSGLFVLLMAPTSSSRCGCWPPTTMTGWRRSAPPKAWPRSRRGDEAPAGPRADAVGRAGDRVR